MSSLKSKRKTSKRAKAINRIVAASVAMFLLLSQVTVLAFAQAETGQISGTVLDPNGAVVAGASIILKSVDTGAERHTVRPMQELI